MTKRISILGSTGSIGCSTMRVVDAFDGEFVVAALGAGSNLEVLTEQIIKYKPELVSVSDERGANKLLQHLKSQGVSNIPKIVYGIEGLIEVACYQDVDIVVGAVVGAMGLVPTLRAIELGRRVALANKETLVIAGELVTETARKYNSEILPVDSEHNAIHQCLRGLSHGKKHELKRLILTASGGPFRNSPIEFIENATPADALKHPTWNMGAKITIDSATLMNKGLEVIEARWLFDCPPNQIDIVVHPQSVVHSMIEFIDGSIIAQLGVTDMRHPIQYALTYPDRRDTGSPTLNLTTLSKLEFFEPDINKFPAVNLAYNAIGVGGTMPAVLNAANEVAVSAFLKEQIKFGDIPRLIRAACDAHSPLSALSIDNIINADKWAREFVSQEISNRQSLGAHASSLHE